MSDFILGNNTNVSTIGNENLNQRNGNPNDNFENFVGGPSQKQVIESSIDDKIRRAVDNVVLSVENRMHDPILTAVDKVVITRVETAVRSIAVSIGHGPNSDVQNPERRDFLGNVGNTPLMSASSRLDINMNHDRIDKTRKKDFEVGDILVLKPNYDRGTHAHHNGKFFCNNSFTITYILQFFIIFGISESFGKKSFLANI